MKCPPEVIDSLRAYFISDEFYFLLALLGGAVIIFFLSKFVLNPLFIRVICARKKSWSTIFKKKNTLSPVAYMLPIMFLMTTSQYLPVTWVYIERFLNGAFAFLITLLIVNVIYTSHKIYETYPISKERPIKSYRQLASLIVYIVGSIIVFCILLDKSPTFFLGGAVAVLAGILLIFKDTILSFVASLNIITHRLILVGDWVEIPAFNADGRVIDIALHIIRVQNFDNSIVSIPTHRLLEAGFQNWEGMYKEGARRIKRSILIDQTSIHFMTEKKLQQLYAHPLVSKVLPPVKSLLKIHDCKDIEGLTNLCAFRTYILESLRHNPKIHQDRTMVVRLLDPTADGIPLQVYAYATETTLTHYEEIQSELFERILALLPVFGLYVFQNLKDQQQITNS